MSRSRRPVLLAALTGMLLLLAAPAWADPAGPTNYRAEVTDVSPGSVPVTAEVHGGDSYLVLDVLDGVEVVVPGYDEEELYLRVDPDGTVHENRASATYFQNQERYGAPIPPSAGPDAEPQWVQVSDDGTFAWHDHRIHWMSPTPPPQVDTDAGEPQPVYDWEVPLVVDGEPATIAGSLTWYPSPAPVVPVLAVVVALAAAVVVASRSTAAAVVVAVVAGVLVLAVVLAGRVGLPAGVQAEPALLPPAIVAVAAPALALLGRNRPAGERFALAGLGALTAILAVVLQGGALTRPVVPNLLPGTVVRVLLGLALGLAIGVLVAVVRGLVGGPSAAPEESSNGEPVGETG